MLVRDDASRLECPCKPASCREAGSIPNLLAKLESKSEFVKVATDLEEKSVALTPSGNSAFDAAVFKAERAFQIVLGAPGLTPAQATAATKRFLEIIITAGVLYEIATPDEMATLSELNRTNVRPALAGQSSVRQRTGEHRAPD